MKYLLLYALMALGTCAARADSELDEIEQIMRIQQMNNNNLQNGLNRAYQGIRMIEQAGRPEPRAPMPKVFTTTHCQRLPNGIVQCLSQ